MAKAPVAAKRPFQRTIHGIVVGDDYAWLKDAKWQDVLRDPSVLDPDIRACLEAENQYTETLLAPLTSLQAELVAEMRGRIKEDDSGVPSPDGPYAYFWKYRPGGQHELIVRMPRDGGETEMVLDGDALAKTSGYSARRHATCAKPSAGSLECRPQGLGIFHHSRARLEDRRRSGGCHRADHRQRRLGP